MLPRTVQVLQPDPEEEAVIHCPPCEPAVRHGANRAFGRKDEDQDLAD